MFKRVFAADLSAPRVSRTTPSHDLQQQTRCVAAIVPGWHWISLKQLTHDVFTADGDFQRGLFPFCSAVTAAATTGGMVLDLVNPGLVDQVQPLLRRPGLSRVRQYVNQAGNVTGQVFVPGLPGANEEFIFDVGKNLHNYVGRRGRRARHTRSFMGGTCTDPRVSARRKFLEKVYNLHVEGTHTYTIRGPVVHNCFLLRIEDNMESIGRSINSALQLSKRGGGVACC